MNPLLYYRINTLALFFFTALLLVSGLYSELFRPQARLSSNEKILLINPIRKDILRNLVEIRINNSNQDFLLKKQDLEWQLVSPVKMKANINNLNKVISTLNSIEIKTLYDFDAVNQENFGLNRPLVSLGIKSSLGESQEIELGLVNTIDDSSYLRVSNFDAIFQTNIISNELNRLKLGDFIDNKIFPKQIENINRLTILSPNYPQGNQVLKKLQDTWISNNYRSITNEAVTTKIQAILDIPAKIILDDLDESSKIFINNYLDKPKYKLIIKPHNGDSRSFLISQLTTQNDTLKLQKNNNFLVKDLELQKLYVVDAQYLDQLRVRYTDLR